MTDIYLFILGCFSKIYVTLKSWKANLIILFLVSLVAIFALYRHGKSVEFEKRHTRIHAQ